MNESFLQYFVSDKKEQKMSDVQSAVILGAIGEEENLMLGVKYFQNQKEATLFYKIVGDFMQDALMEMGLSLFLETPKRTFEWPEA